VGRGRGIIRAGVSTGCDGTGLTDRFFGGGASVSAFAFQIDDVRFE
jgi:hypothetical protein